ncbi:hypothetical protein M3Y98_00759100 [Aphelenchoides besseyi]|nr:hypothetical protein M3Y98_00759100 [Aphelenchoides besseyi]
MRLWRIGPTLLLLLLISGFANGWWLFGNDDETPTTQKPSVARSQRRKFGALDINVPVEEEAESTTAIIVSATESVIEASETPLEVQTTNEIVTDEIQEGTTPELSVETTEEPKEVEETTQLSVNSTPQLETTTESTLNEEELIQTTLPVETSETTTEKTVETTEMPLETSQIPIQTTEKSIETIGPFVETTGDHEELIPEVQPTIAEATTQSIELQTPGPTDESQDVGDLPTESLAEESGQELPEENIYFTHVDSRLNQIETQKPTEPTTSQPHPTRRYNCEFVQNWQ